MIDKLKKIEEQYFVSLFYEQVRNNTTPQVMAAFDPKYREWYLEQTLGQLVEWSFDV